MHETADRTRTLHLVLGGRKVLRKPVHHFRMFAQLVRDGLPYAALTSVSKRLDVHESELADVIGIAHRTLARRREAQQLGGVESDRLFRVAKVLARAASTLGSLEKASRWMRRSNQALGGERPLDLLDTEVGEEEVLTLLGRIEHGIAS